MTALEELARAALEGRAYVEVEYGHGDPYRYWVKVWPEDPAKVKARLDYYAAATETYVRAVR